MDLPSIGLVHSEKGIFVALSNREFPYLGARSKSWCLAFLHLDWFLQCRFVEVQVPPLIQENVTRNAYIDVDLMHVAIVLRYSIDPFPRFDRIKSSESGKLLGSN